MDRKNILEVIEMLESVRMKIFEVRKSIGPEKNDEDSEEWLVDCALEDAADSCRSSVEEIESAMQEEMEV